MGRMPLTKTVVSLWTTACEYGPMAGDACGVDTVATPLLAIAELFSQSPRTLRSAVTSCKLCVCHSFIVMDGK